MAISVDDVYKTVLLILNKEQRGYITPDEFNKTATQGQLDIFEQYFDDLNVFFGGVQAVDGNLNGGCDSRRGAAVIKVD